MHKVEEIFDLTPTWSGVMPALIAAVEDGTAQGQQMARNELYRLAQTLDSVGVMLGSVKRYSKHLSAEHRAPTGDDYNELLRLLGIEHDGATPVKRLQSKQTRR